MADDFGYHIDHHGSLVRPPALLAARARGLRGEALAAAEDEAVAALAHALRRLTLSACCDGQFRRSYFESVVHDRVSGFAWSDGPAPLADLAGIAAARRRAIPDAGALAAAGRLAQAEAAPVLATVDRSVFVTLPSPGYLAAAGSALADASAIDAVRAAGAALAAMLRDEIAGLAADGVLYVALENPLYVPLLTADGRAAAAAAGIDVAAALAALTEADRAVFAGLDVPAGFRVGLDLTDSGPLPLTSSGYDATAVAALLDETPFPRISVDYPANPAARFPVELVKPGIVVSLGVVDVSTPAAEAVEELLDRLDPIAEERGDADIAVATNGGFAQVADQPLMTAPEQHAKLQLVEMAARYYWGNEILWPAIRRSGARSCARSWPPRRAYWRGMSWWGCSAT
jgi:5-methyltetrahydropteroyltriglutamate--homocysteine methyltransferase